MSTIELVDPELRDALAATPPGEAVKPFFSPAGVELIVRCDVVSPSLRAFELPSRDQLQQQLFAQKMSLYAKSYLHELKQNGVVYETVSK